MLTGPAKRWRMAEGSASATKQNQAKPNKSKQNCLDLLISIRANLDFSTGYSEFKSILG
jgi:hypothetical protein